jgi:D-3-phosphoglycerate dehydrogenase
MKQSAAQAGQRLVVALDDGYAAYDQEHNILAQAGARFELRPCRHDEACIQEAVRDADVVLVRESPIGRATIQAMTRCKAIIRYGIGVDNIDQVAATERSIQVANVPDYGTDEVSSHAVALTLAISRRLWLHDREVREGRWSTGVLQPMYRLRGRTLGLVGFGRIARMTMEKLSGFGFARVLVCDPKNTLPTGVEGVDMHTLCAESDVISLHAPLTPKTKHLIDRRRLALMTPTTILINTARGGLVNSDDLFEALSTRQIFGAGLDVFEPEPPGNHPLFKLDNVVVTNHIAWYSEEAMRDLQRKTAEEAARVLSGQNPFNWLNRW